MKISIQLLPIHNVAAYMEWRNETMHELFGDACRLLNVLGPDASRVEVLTIGTQVHNLSDAHAFPKMVLKICDEQVEVEWQVWLGSVEGHVGDDFVMLGLEALQEKLPGARYDHEQYAAKSKEFEQRLKRQIKLLKG